MITEQPLPLQTHPRASAFFERMGRRPPRWVRWGLYAVLAGGLLASRFAPPLAVFFPLSFTIPVLAASWWDGRKWGYGLACVAMVAAPIPLTPLHWVMRAIGLVLMVEFVSRTALLARRVRVLEGLLPICTLCRRIRTEKGQWMRFELFIQGHSEAGVLHTFCPTCTGPNQDTPPIVMSGGNG